MILKVGLTGGTASGKSTVARHLAQRSCVVIDADALVHQLYRPEEEGYRAVVKHFGSSILSADGTIDRNRLAELAFQSPEKTAELNALVHPLVIAREAELIEQLGDEDRIVVVEATLLLEAGGRERYDRIVVLEAPREIQVQRAVRRGMAREDAERRIDRQMKPEQRLQLADYIVRNDGDEAKLAQETDSLYRQLRQDLTNKIAQSRNREIAQ